MAIRVLFVCTGNSARSILAEASLRALGGSRFEACSAGSHPTGRVNPYALVTLEAAGMSCSGLRSKSWDEFTGDNAPAIDLVITVCDSAAAESCPLVLGDFLRTHWGMPDPAATDGGDADKRDAFKQTHALIMTRLQAMLSLPERQWQDRQALKAALDRIGLIGA